MTRFIAFWIAAVLRLFLPAILVYFLALKPLIGAGYGVWYTLAYLFVICPCAAAWLLGKKPAFDRQKDKSSQTVD